MAIRVLVVEDEAEEQAAYQAAIEREQGFVLLGMADCVENAIAATKAYAPDAVILDLELSHSHGIDYLKYLGEAPAPVPSVFVITSVTGPSTRAAVRAMGAERVFSKSDRNYCPELVLDFIYEISPYFAANRCISGSGAAALSPADRESHDEAVRKRIQADLVRYGASSGTLNLDYTVWTVFELSRLPYCGAINLKKTIYPKLYKQFGKSYTTIIRGIQYCITSMWDNPGQPNISEIYPAPVDKKRGMAELKQLLICLANRYRDEKSHSL